MDKMVHFAIVRGEVCYPVCDVYDSDDIFLYDWDMVECSYCIELKGIEEE